MAEEPPRLEQVALFAGGPALGDQQSEHMPGWISWTCFGTRAEIPLALPMGVMTFGIALHGVSYGYLRGSGQVMRANAIQLLALGIWPCLAFVLTDELA